MSHALLSDLYQLKMIYAHWKNGTAQTPVTFDLFYRTAPHGGSGAVVAGVYEALQWLTDLCFTEEDIAYLRQADAELAACEPAFWDEVIRPFRFTGSVDAMLDGTYAFPGEPIMRITTPVAEAQYIESALLSCVNGMTLVASKAARIVTAAGQDPVIEMGLRRAQSLDSAVNGAKAAYIAGVASTATIEAGRRYGIPVTGTTAHAWFQFFASELEAMHRWAAVYDNLVFVIDTYDTLRSGLPNAMAVARESGKRLAAVRLDSGDLAFLSKKARAMLDREGFTETKIIASSDLDEEIILSLKVQGAPIDSWGVGTQLITGGKQASLGGVYKLSAVGQALAEAADPIAVAWEPRIKLSENPIKVTIPGRKQVIRFYVEGKMAGDLIALEEEPLPDGSAPYTLTDPVHRWKRRTLKAYQAVPLLEPMVRDGRIVHPELADRHGSMMAARARCADQRAALCEECRRLLNPELYPVGMSNQLWGLQHRMIEEGRPHNGQ